MQIIISGKFSDSMAFGTKEHIRFFSIKDFIKTANASGFTVRKIKVSSGTRILKYLRPNLFADQVCFLLE